MIKLIATNTIIPLFTIVFSILEEARINNERILSVEYRLWMFDHGHLFLFAQIVILIISWFVWRSKKARVTCVSIFFAWILIGFLLAKNSSGVFD